MHERHSNKRQYFEEQYHTCKKHLLPFIEEKKTIQHDIHILEVGCGFGGNLLPFLELGCQVTGVEILPSSIQLAKEFIPQSDWPNLTLICNNIFDCTGFNGKFDIILMKDTIEHIQDQNKLMSQMRTWLKSEGVIFQAFPPWVNPFGGHQQMCKSRVLSRLPWLHLLPRSMYRGVLALFGENKSTINSLIHDVYDTGISSNRFFRICKRNQYALIHSRFYFINPNYEIKFSLKPRKLWGIFNIPIIRDFYTTTVYCLLTKI
ncbi:MAG: hypothetical protein RIQ90_1734 [Bacteroidota bacterium]|jgi:SAM-dependent methyltransferase